MTDLIVEGGVRLSGQLTASGAKNSALPALVAAALADGGPVHLEHVPTDADVATMIQLLRSLGVRVEIGPEPGGVTVYGGELRSTEAPYTLVRRMRASFYVAGLLLARAKEATVPLPGGCALGSRPVDYHLRGFEAMGAAIQIEGGSMRALAPSGLAGASIQLSRPSVGTTIQLMMTASLARGTTTLENAALEPEVVDVASLLNLMGARIRGAGTPIVRIEGVEGLHGCRYAIIPDRIEIATWLVAGAITGGEVAVHGALAEHLHMPLAKLKEAGYLICQTPDMVALSTPPGLARPHAVDLETAPYPGFPTDLQQPFAALLTIADGTSMVRETIFDRFRYVDELRRMGADVRVERDTAIIRGVPRLTGARVEATDLRGGAALLLAALAAEGETRIENAEMIDRGYEALEAKVAALGGRIRREPGTRVPDGGVAEDWRAVFERPLPARHS